MAARKAEELSFSPVGSPPKSAGETVVAPAAVVRVTVAAVVVVALPSPYAICVGCQSEGAVLRRSVAALRPSNIPLASSGTCDGSESRAQNSSSGSIKHPCPWPLAPWRPACATSSGQSRSCAAAAVDPRSWSWSWRADRARDGDGPWTKITRDP
jgi:hypothetical protein